MALATTIKIKRYSITDEAISRVRRTIGDDEDRELDDATARDVLEDCAYQEDCGGGVFFDWNLAASEALLRLATRYRNQVRSSASGQSVDWQQKAEAAERQSGIFAAKALPRVADISRNDTWW